MPFFTRAKKINIFGGFFTDIHQVGGHMSIQQGDTTPQSLLSATATGATYDSQERYPPPKCHPRTRQAILKKIDGWIADRDTTGSVMWLHGPAGSGKSAIAQTICESNAAVLAASFFFSRAHPPRNCIESFFTTIAFQMAMSTQDLRHRITQAVHDNPLIVHATTAAQVEHLIITPIRTSASKKAMSQRPFLIVVDGLDECRGNDNQSLLLAHLLDLIRVHHLHLYLLVVSRPEPHIKHAFGGVIMENFQVVSLCGDHQAYADIYAFLEDGFKAIHDAERHSAIMDSVPRPWPSQPVLAILTLKSGGYFIYAATVLRFVDEEYFSPIERLNAVANEILDAAPTSSTTAFAELDKLYTQILSTSPNPTLLKRIIGCILLPIYPDIDGARKVTASMMELFFGLKAGEAMLTLRGLHSLLAFDKITESRAHLDSSHYIDPEQGEICIKSLHASLADFVFNKERAGIFFIDTQEHQSFIIDSAWKRFANWSDAEPGGSPRSDSAIQYLLDSFVFHFSQVRDKHKVLESLHIANTTTWAPVVHASKNWLILNKQVMIEVVEDALREFKALVPPPRDTILELTTLIDFIYSVHLSPQSPGATQFIQRIYTMFGAIQVLGVQEYDTAWATAQLLQLSHLMEPSWQGIHAYMNTWFGRHAYIDGTPEPLCQRPSFLDFMSDPRRCGNLFIEPGTCHSYLTLCCMEAIAAKGTLTSPKWPSLLSVRQYARRHLSMHLLRAPPGEKTMLDYLRKLDFRVIFSNGDAYSNNATWSDMAPHASEVVAWLERIPTPPMDILSLWRAYLQVLESKKDIDITSTKEDVARQEQRKG